MTTYDDALRALDAYLDWANDLDGRIEVDNANTNMSFRIEHLRVIRARLAQEGIK
jgi:hypothetical protein